MKRRLFLAVSAATLSAGLAFAQDAPSSNPAAIRTGAYALDKSHAKLNWATSHFGFSTYSGEFTDFDARLTLDPARPAAGTLAVTIQTASIETNNDKLDEHLRSADFFNADRFPAATFRSTRIEPVGPRSARVTGDLTLLGKTRPVTLAVTFNGAGENPVSKAYTVGFSATGVIKRTEFGMSTYAPAVGDDVRLTIDGEFNPAT